ncbi:MAG: hypothetical protein WC162_01740 [Sphaerochaetaceae bacterium]
MTITKLRFFALTFFLIIFSFSIYGKTLTLSQTSLKEGHRLSFDFQDNSIRLFGALKMDEHNFEILFPRTLQFQSNNLFFGQFNPSGTFRLLLYPMDLALSEDSNSKIFSPGMKLSGPSQLTGLIYSPMKELSFLKTSPVYNSTSLDTIGIFFNSPCFYVNDLLFLNAPKSSNGPYQIDWDVFSFQKIINFIIIGGKISSEFFTSSWYLQNAYRKNSSIFFNYSLNFSFFIKNMTFSYTKKQGQNIIEPLLIHSKLFPAVINKYSFKSKSSPSVNFEINYSISEYPGPKISGKSQRRIYLMQLIISQEIFSYSKSIKNEYSEKRKQIITSNQIIQFEIPTKKHPCKFSLEIKDMQEFNLKFSTLNLDIDYQIEKEIVKITIKHTFQDSNKTLTISFDQDQVFSFSFKMNF